MKSFLILQLCTNVVLMCGIVYLFFQNVALWKAIQRQGELGARLAGVDQQVAKVLEIHANQIKILFG